MVWEASHSTVWTVKETYYEAKETYCEAKKTCVTNSLPVSHISNTLATH